MLLQCYLQSLINSHDHHIPNFLQMSNEMGSQIPIKIRKLMKITHICVGKIAQ